MALEEFIGNPENLFGHAVGDEIQRTMNDDPIYASFIGGLTTDPSTLDETWNEENDEDYNVFQEDDEVQDNDEYRNDRSTKISS